MSPSQAPAQADASRLTLPIQGMSCASCAGRVEKALTKVPGVQSAEVNLATERAQVQIAPSVSPQSLVSAVEQAGFQVPSDTVELAILV